MPQLNTSPWLMVFMVTWLALILYGTKVIKLQEPKTSTMHQTHNKKPAHWQWP